MIPLWTAAEAAAATGGKVTQPWTADGVSIDSRTLRPGELFVALIGPTHDGHDHVGAAFEKGAAAAMVSRPPRGFPPGAPLLVVPDTLRGLEALGMAGRARSRARVVAVTGSVGKTSTKEALRHVLAAQGSTHASAASHNNHWGVPLSLARLPPDAAYGVFELGMNHAGEIRTLTAQVRPHVAVITWVAPAHLEFFADEAAIADAKAEIFEGLEPGGVAVLPRDNPHFPRLRAAAERAGAARVLSFGVHERADWRLAAAELRPEASRVTVAYRGTELRYRLSVPGRHWIANSLAVLAAVEAVGADVRAAADALASVAPPSGRGARHAIRVQGGTALLLDESYNANPASMRAAIELLGQMPGRRVVVLGDMLELGPAGPRLHAELAGPLAEAGVAEVLSCGPLMVHLHRELPDPIRGHHAVDSAALLPYVRDALQPGDAILVKGSLGSRMRPIVQALLEGPPSAASGGRG